VARLERELAAALVQRAEHRPPWHVRDALDDLRRAAGLDARSAAAHHAIAALVPDDEGAIESASRALELEPTNAAYYLTRADCHERRGDEERALADCNRAVQLCPREPVGYVVRARLHEKMGRLREAYEDLSRALRIRPDDGGLLRERVAVLRKLGDEDATLREIDRVLEADPEHHGCRLERVLLGMRTGALEQARADATRLVRASARDRAAYERYLRAAVLIRMNQPKEALADLVHASATEPLNAYFRARLAQCHLALGAIEEALSGYDEAVSLDPSCVDFRLWRARILASAGGEDALRRAHDDVRHAISLEPEVASHRAERAMVHLGSGRRSLAISELERAVELFAKRRACYQPHARHWLLAQYESAGLDLGHAAPISIRQVRALLASLRARPARRRS
jgi:tetratricopeptide (TPR) repeat protein